MIPTSRPRRTGSLELYAIADGKVEPEAGRPDRGDLRRRVRAAEPPAPPRQAVGRGEWQGKDPDRAPRRRRRATYKRPHGVRHLLAAYDLSTDRLYGHVKTKKGRTEFLAFCRYVAVASPGRRADRHRAATTSAPT